MNTTALKSSHNTFETAGTDKLAYTPREVARMLSLSERMVRKLEYSGELKAVRLGRAVRFTPEAINEYLTNAGA